ncbi:cytochrome P450 [Frankia sp. EI5c]|uniref:cytochrome P450 n=1 Tax=Frankia sp. EI5c TaxID=683316 RepID=UPI0007C3B599|nr:cytochrome P450 [Frankia sp. EI5c]OAA24569.1 cytochrome P450 [Frankia sp. EI5c]
MSTSTSTSGRSGAAAEAGAEAGTAVPPPECPAHAAFGQGAALTALYGPEAQHDPRAVYEKLRAEHGGIAPVELEGGVPAWLVLGYRENMEVARTPMRFTRDARFWRDWTEGRIAADDPLIPLIGWRPDVVSYDGEEHQRLRAAVNECLTRFDRHGTRRHVQRYANQLIDGFVQDGTADLVSQFAAYLPMLVLSRLVGLGEEHGPKLVEAIVGMVNGGEEAYARNQYIIGTLRSLTEERRKVPAHDLASWFIQHHSGLNDEEVLNHLRLVIVLGYEATTNLVSNTLRMVLTDPRFRASLAGGLMTLPDAVEQMLWDDPPLLVCPARFATHDLQFAGKEIREGDMLLLGIAAGNADPQIRPNLGAPMHGNRSHLAFSRGPHECSGQEIARAITDTGVDVLLNRLPDLHLAVREDQLTWTASTWSRRLDALPVRFAPQRRPVQQPAPAAPAASAAVEPSAAKHALEALEAVAEAGGQARTDTRRGFRASLIGLFRGRP